MLGSTWSEAFQRGGQDGKEATHSGADHHCTAGREAEVGLARGTSVKLISPGARHHRADVLAVEAGVRRDEGEPGTAPEGARARERAPEASRADLTLDKLILEEAAKGNSEPRAPPTLCGACTSAARGVGEESVPGARAATHDAAPGEESGE